MENKVKGLEDLFWKFLLINPFLDILNGLYIHWLKTSFGYIYNEANIALTPTLIFRMSVLLIFVWYIIKLKDKKSIICVVPIGLAWVFSVISELMIGGPVSIFTDIQYFAKFCYNIGVVLAYAHLFKRSTLSKKELIEKINRIVCLTLILLSLAILIPYALGLGLTTYADRFGYRGTRGYFYSGNDITAIFMLLLPVASCHFMALPQDKLEKKTKIFYALGPAFTSISLCLIGTKTAFIAVAVTLGAIFVYALVIYCKEKNIEYIKRIGYIIVATLSVLLVLIVMQSSTLETISESFNTTSEVMDRDGGATALLSGRQNKLANAWEQYKNSGIFGYIFGIGRGSQEFVIEMDLFEVVMYYGIFGFIAMLWIYLKLGFTFIGKFFKNFTVEGLGIFISLGLCVGYLTMAGHVLFSVTSGFYFAFILVYSNLVYDKKDKHILSFK